KRRYALLAVVALMAACDVTAQNPTPPPSQPTTQSSAQPPAQNPTPASTKADPWAGVRFLLGLWEAKTTGGVAQAQVSTSYSFRMELRDHLMARHSRSGACSAPDDFDCQHSDLLYIYLAANGQSLEAIYFDNEGHVIHYGVTTPKLGTVVFLSDPALPGPQYRLSYTFLDGVMSGQFEMKTPGQMEFTSY